MLTQTMLGVPIPKDTKEQVLEKIKKNIENPVDYFHIVSLNPEILVMSQKDKTFAAYLSWAQMRILDGSGVFLVARLRGYDIGDRYTGVDLMEKLLFLANSMGLRVGLIGGKGNLAQKVVDCQKERFPRVKFLAIEGIKDIHHPKDEEEEKVLSIVADYKPHLIFVAFGSPFQELWLNKHKERLKGIICMGVGGAFDFLSGNITRAPYLIRKLGLEWLYRLIRQPWRFKRQARLVTFLVLMFREMLSSTRHNSEK